MKPSMPAQATHLTLHQLAQVKAAFSCPGRWLSLISLLWGFTKQSSDLLQQTTKVAEPAKVTQQQTATADRAWQGSCSPNVSLSLHPETLFCDDESAVA